MTNNPNQHQPDGDGLRNRILNLIPDVSVIPLDRAFGLLREIRAVCLAPPTRDGAEGTGRDAGIADAIFDIEGGEPPPKPAPPKPAPDAVRSLIARAVCCPQGCQYEGDSEDGNKCYCDTSDYRGSGIEKRANAVLTIVAAPVPSPGGAGEFKDEEKTILEFFDNAEDADLADETWSLNATNARKALNTILEAALTRRSEPETEQQFEDRLFKQDAADMMRLLDYIADKIGLPHNEEISRDNFNAWLATPPVRGDREAIARIIDPRVIWKEIPGVHWSIADNERKRDALAKADAILSLPVQSAPDREQLREAIACAYALTQWHEKLENLEGSMQDGCRGFANRVVAALPVQSGEVITKEAAEAATKRAT